MKYVRKYIEERQARFAENAFFHHLESIASPQEALGFIRGLTFFVMAFQDILRLNESNVEDPKLRRVARHHRLEDSGHDAWFLHDLDEADGDIPDTRELFDDAHATVRDAAYALMSEVFRASDDHTRIALLLVLESTGHAFFTRVVDYLERSGYRGELQYFARSHLDVELGHELFDRQLDAMLDSISLDVERRTDVLESVDRGFDAITGMIESLVAWVGTARTERPAKTSAPPVSMTVPRHAPRKSARPLQRVG